MTDLNKEDNIEKKSDAAKKDEKKELTLEEKLKDTEEKLLRSLAEIDNQRKRFEKDIQEALEFGGLSNYGGLQIDHNIFPDLKCLSKKNKKKLEKSFFEIAQKAKFLGKFNLNKKDYQNDFKIDNSFSNLLTKRKINDFEITKPILAISGKQKNVKKKINLNSIKESTNKINAQNYYKKFLKNKNINFHNYVVEKIFSKKNKFALVCKNKNQKKIFYANKVVFACGTLVTTKLIMDFLNIKKEIKIKEHPRLISLFFSKYKIENYLNFMPSQMLIRKDSTSKSFLIDFRPGNKSIIDTATKIYKFLFPIKFLLNSFRNHMIFSNILLDSRCSNLFMKLKNNSKALIYSKNRGALSAFKKIHKKIFKLLRKENLIYPIYKNFFTGSGSAYHYFGTLPITNKNKKMSVNNLCQLKNFKNIYIVDGSVFDVLILNSGPSLEI